MRANALVNPEASGDMLQLYRNQERKDSREWEQGVRMANGFMKKDSEGVRLQFDEKILERKSVMCMFWKRKDGRPGERGLMNETKTTKRTGEVEERV